MLAQMTELSGQSTDPTSVETVWTSRYYMCHAGAVLLNNKGDVVKMSLYYRQLLCTVPLEKGSMNVQVVLPQVPI